MKQIIRIGISAALAGWLHWVATWVLGNMPHTRTVSAAPLNRPQFSHSAITVETVSTAGLTATYNAADTDGIKFLNRNGNVIVHVKNDNTVDTVITIEIGPTYNGLSFENPTVTCPADTECFIGAFRTFFNQPSDTSYLYLDFSVATSVTVAVIQVEDMP